MGKTDGDRLADLLGERSRAEFARKHGIKGGGSMIIVLAELQGLSPSRWAAVRAVLDQVVMRPDLADEAAAELLHLLTTRPDKRPGAG